MTDDIRICFLGDSFVHGTGDDGARGWVGRVCAAARRGGVALTGYNLGVRRDTSADVAARWIAECEPRLPADVDARVVLSFGTNDTTVEGASCRVDPGASVAHLEAMLRTAARRGWRALFVGPPPIADTAQNRRTEALSARLVATADAAGVPALAVFAALAADPVWMREVAAHDGAHPGDPGYERWAQLILSWEGWWFPST